MKTKGFTLIELLVVISIISMLSSITLASLSSARIKGQIGAGLLFANHFYQAYGANNSIAIYKSFESDGNLQDSSSHGYDLATSNLSPIVRSTNSPGGRNSVLLTNSGPYLQTNTISPPLNYPSYTMMAWIYFNEVPSGDQVIASLTDGSTPPGFQSPLEMYYDSEFGIGCHSNNFGGTRLRVFYGNLEAKRWYHVACSLNRTTGTLAIYVYGTKIKEVTGTPGTQYPLNQIMVGNDGGYQYSSDLHAFEGYIYDLGVYSQPVL